MNKSVAIIMPAYRAQDTIVGAVQSVLAQTWADWELVIVSDDGLDYAALLDQAGIADHRIRQLSSGRIGGGASAARNMALEAIGTDHAAILDADDRLKPRKLELVVAALEHHGIVSTALEVMDEGFSHLRHVGDGPDLVLAPGEYKWVNLSMDSMIAWDRRRADGRYDPGMSNMTDLEFLLQLYRTVPSAFHLGTPLHDYVKRAGSMSNGPKVASGMIASKATLLERLGAGYYQLAGGGVEGIERFLRISLQAEGLYAAAQQARPGLLFEDHLEPMLRAV